MTGMPVPGAARPWQDATVGAADRVVALLAEMSLEEKLAQLGSVWIGGGSDDADVAPLQRELADDQTEFAAATRRGLGQLTRPFGSAPVDPAGGAKTLARLQADVAAANRFGIPAIVHEECLTGFMTWGATIFPTPLAWGATFDPELISRMAAQVGHSMRTVGAHQGLAPVLDVTRDARWGRTEETIGEDPYLVGTIGTAYVQGLQSAGVIATLKHFAGYSGSAGGRNFGPVSAGPRELADVVLPPFEMAVRHGARSVMHSYAEIDGIPAAADGSLLGDLLRRAWGFRGTVVADYNGVAFLELMHGVAGSPAEAAALALAAGIDVELPSTRCYGEPLLAAVRAGTVSESLVDRAATRVLLQKCELGLLDADWDPRPPALRESGDASAVDLDPPAARAVARQVAEESVVLLANDGTLPLRSDGRIAVVGPLADDPFAMLGCYAFPSHVAGAPDGPRPPAPLGVPVATLLSGLRAELPDAQISHAPGCDVLDSGVSGIEAAVAAAEQAQVCVVVLGDRSGLFGRGTSGEGCDREDLRLPGIQEQLLRELIDTGTPVVVVLLSGRPYALGAIADQVAGIVQAFFPGEEGGAAVSGVLTGRLCPAGRLPVSMPARPGGGARTYLGPRLAHRSSVSSVDPTPLFPFGHGLSYTSFAWDDIRVDGRSTTAPVQITTDGSVTVSVRVRNTGERAGAEVVQLYLHDPVAQVTRPVVRLIGFARVPLEPGQSRRVSFDVHADLAAFTGQDGRRIVEPGALELRLARSCADTVHSVPITLVGAERTVDHTRTLDTPATVS